MSQVRAYLSEGLVSVVRKTQLEIPIPQDHREHVQQTTDRQRAVGAESRGNAEESIALIDFQILQGVDDIETRNPADHHS